MSSLLETRSLCVAVGQRRVVEDVSLAVSAGEVVALLGPNGAGKTSLMRAALGLVRPSEGAATLGGVDVQALSAHERALRAAYLPQRPGAVWPIPVESLVALGRYAYGAAPERLSSTDQQAVDEAIGACALRGLRKRRMDELSGGEKARAHLARALAQGAPLLVLDEPTAGLDPAQSLSVAEIMRAHAYRGDGLLMSTHDVALAARVADRVLLMRDGRTLAQGEPESALTPEALKAAYDREGRLERAGEAWAAWFR
jgi:iron complex transport system ATP-binding protein